MDTFGRWAVAVPVDVAVSAFPTLTPPVSCTKQRLQKTLYGENLTLTHPEVCGVFHMLLLH